jgi:hypothetical protein
MTLNLVGQYYTRRFSRRYPGLFIILLDQSGSMREKVDGQKYSKADFATTALNNLIHKMVQSAKFEASTGERRKYAYLSIFGYSDSVYPLLSPSGEPVDIPFLGKNPRGTVQVIRDVLDTHTNTYHSVTENRPFWIEPRSLGRTQMAEAFTRARDIAGLWLNSPPEPGQAQRQECFPPIIINITDGEDNGGGNLLAVAQEIRSKGTQQGGILIFNCHFTKAIGQSCVFPGSAAELTYLNSPFAQQLFEVSSVIPEPLRRRAASELLRGQDLPDTARSFVYNADTDILIKFLHWGTVGTAIE